MSYADLMHRSADEFADRVALITGGTEGIGQAAATLLAEAGATVYVCGRSAEKGERTVALNPERLRFIQTDLTDANACAGLAPQVAEMSGRLDYLVNNAADDTRLDFASATHDDFERQMHINLRPMFTVTQAAMPAMRDSAGKAIVNLSSTNYMLGLVPFTVYNAFKSGIVGFSRSLARELGPEGFRVNVVSPGWIMTPKQLEKYVTEQDKAQLIEDQCVKRLMTAEDVAPVIMFLLSSMAAGMTGQNLVVDGGKVMQ